MLLLFVSALDPEHVPTYLGRLATSSPAHPLLRHRSFHTQFPIVASLILLHLTILRFTYSSNFHNFALHVASIRLTPWTREYANLFAMMLSGVSPSSWPLHGQKTNREFKNCSARTTLQPTRWQTNVPIRVRSLGERQESTTYTNGIYSRTYPRFACTRKHRRKRSQFNDAPWTPSVYRSRPQPATLPESVHWRKRRTEDASCRS